MIINSVEAVSEKVNIEFLITTFHKKTHDAVLDFLKQKNLSPLSNKIVDDNVAYSYITVVGSKKQYDLLSEQNFRISLDYI